MSWKQYERYITEHFRVLYPGATIHHDQKKLGIFSKQNRQIDLLITSEIAGFKTEIVIDCKYFSERVDVKEVDSFIGFLADVRASKGVLITNIGYSEAALNRAKHDGRDIEVRILDFEDLKSFNGFAGAIVHRGPCGVILPCPTNWVLHPQPALPTFLCIFSRPGRTWQQALHDREYMYVDFSIKTIFPTIQGLLSFQESETKKGHQNAAFEYDFSPKTPYATKFGRQVILRRIKYQNQPIPEWTAFVEFEDFFCFTVLSTPEKSYLRDAKKHGFVCRTMIPLLVIDSRKRIDDPPN